jgi:hypothetical protein
LKLLFDGFTDNERSTLNRLLRKLANNLSQLEHAAGDSP